MSPSSYKAKCHLSPHHSHSSSSPIAPAEAAAAAAKEEMHSVLVTGGAGFIGTHTVLQLLKDGLRITVIDNLDNSVEDTVDRVCDLAGPALSKNLIFFLVNPNPNP